MQQYPYYGWQGPARWESVSLISALRLRQRFVTRLLCLAHTLLHRRPRALSRQLLVIRRQSGNQIGVLR
jgi:hypothetical protein